jgi:nucleoside-diphosphate-sugar epimerase
MSVVLITGAFGFVGTSLSAFLAQRRHVLYALDVEERQPSPYSVFHTWDELDAFDWRSVDAVVHLAGKAHDTRQAADPQSYFDVNLGLTQRIFERFLSSRARVFLFFSSVKAAADSVPAGTVLTEDAPADPRTPYGRSKRAAETFLLAAALPPGRRLYILRPCMIHGPGNKGNLNLLYRVASRGIPYPLGAFDNRRSFTSVANLCQAVEGLLAGEAPSGIYQMADDEPVSTNILVALMAESAGRRPRIWRLPPGFVRWCARAGDRLHLPLNTERLEKLTESYVVSNAKLRQALGLERFPVTAEEGLRITLRSFRKE